MGLRKQSLQDWLNRCLAGQSFALEPASNDASFRRYFRVFANGDTWIAMDAPPDKEDCVPFVRIARALTAHGVHAPEIVAENLEQGFLLLSDLGSCWYLDALNEFTAEAMYGDAIDTLIRMQTIDSQDLRLPPYDEALLMREMNLFRDWFLTEFLQVEPDQSLSPVWQALVESALQQPRVFVHRDYHSRNLMVLEQANPGVIDFQDAVHGPITYDLVSLLRDCYIAWPEQRVREWVKEFHRLLMESGTLDDCPVDQFQCWFDLMGVQRHLKAIGIFARLYLRDGKPGYLKDMPRTLSYIVQLGDRYPEIAPLQTFLKQNAIESRLQVALDRMGAVVSAS